MISLRRIFYVRKHPKEKSSKSSAEHFRIHCVVDGSFFCDASIFVQFKKALIHGAHLSGTGRNDTVDLMNFIITDHIPDSRSKTHDLKNRNIFAVDIRNQLLRNDSLKHHRKLHNDLMLLGWFKNIYDTVERICGSECVQTGKDEMTGLGSCHGSLNGFVITHFAKKNDIRALAKGSSQGSNIIFRISAYLTLAYDTFFMGVQVF